MDDAPTISPPSGLPGPPGLNVRRPPMEGPPGPDWQPRDQWRRGGPPQEWRGGFEEEEPASPRRRDTRPSQANNLAVHWLKAAAQELLPTVLIHAGGTPSVHIVERCT